MPKILETSQTNAPGRPNLYKPNDPPLVSVQVTNPLTYLKLWLKKVWANEGIVLHLRIRPLTILMLALLFTGTGVGASKYLSSYLPFDIFPTPIPTEAPTPSPIPIPNPWVDAAYAGILQRMSTGRYYLVISSGEAISLEIPTNINLGTLTGRRVLAYGEYDQSVKLLRVKSATDMEILPSKTVPVPTSVPTATPAITPP